MHDLYQKILSLEAKPISPHHKYITPKKQIYSQNDPTDGANLELCKSRYSIKDARHYVV